MATAGGLDYGLDTGQPTSARPIKPTELNTTTKGHPHQHNPGESNPEHTNAISANQAGLHAAGVQPPQAAQHQTTATLAENPRGTLTPDSTTRQIAISLYPNNQSERIHIPDAEKPAKKQAACQQAGPAPKRRAAEAANPGRIWSLLDLRDDETASHERICQTLSRKLTDSLEPGTRKQKAIFVISKENAKDLQLLVSTLLNSIVATTTPPPIKTLNTLLSEVRNGVQDIRYQITPREARQAHQTAELHQLTIPTHRQIAPASKRKPGNPTNGPAVASWSAIAAAAKPPNTTQQRIPQAKPPLTKKPSYASRMDPTMITLSQPTPYGTAMMSIPLAGLVPTFNNLMVAKNIRSPVTNKVLYARSAFRHASHDITYHFSTPDEASTAKKTVSTWMKALNPRLQYRPTKHQVIVHGISTAFDPQDPNCLDELRIGNPNTLSGDFSAHWINHQTAQDGRKWASLQLSVDTLEEATALVEAAVWFRGGSKPTSHCSQPPARCYNCMHSGHVTSRCPAPPTCPFCGGPHKSLTCPNREHDSPPMCTVCTRKYISLNPQTKIQGYLKTRPKDLQHSPFTDLCPSFTRVCEKDARLAQESSTHLAIQAQDHQKPQNQIREVQMNEPSGKEPYILPHSNFPMSNPNWELIPPNFLHRETQAELNRIRVCFYLNKSLRLDVTAIDTGSRDVVAISIPTPADTVSLVNVYNQPGTFGAFQTLATLLDTTPLARPHPILITTNSNLHHPLWNPEGLLKHEPEADILVELLADRDFNLVSPPGVATFTSSNPQMRIQPTLDLTWTNSPGLDKIVHCLTDQDGTRSFNSDHLSISTLLDIRDPKLTAQPQQQAQRCNWRKVRESPFLDDLAANLGPVPVFRSKIEINKFAAHLTSLVTNLLDKHSPLTHRGFKAKAWWNTTMLDPLKRTANKLCKTYQRTRSVKDRAAYTNAKEKFHQAITEEKKAHRLKFLETLTAANLFTAKKYAQGNPSVNPRLDYLTSDGLRCKSNKDRAAALFKATCEASIPCDLEDIPGTPEHRDPGLGRSQLVVSKEDIKECLASTHPNKAPGPDRIQTWVWSLFWKIVDDHTTALFNACLHLGHFPPTWKLARSVMIPKPGKADYASPSAYHPIALLNTLAKLLEKVMALKITTFAENTGTLPAGH